MACRAAALAGPVAEISTAVSARNPAIPTPTPQPLPPSKVAAPAATTVPTAIGTVADTLGKAAAWPATQAASEALVCRVRMPAAPLRAMFPSAAMRVTSTLTVGISTTPNS